MWLKMLRAGPAGWVAMLEAQVWIIWAHVRVRTVPHGRLISNYEPDPVPAPRARPDPRLNRVAIAISRASRFGVLRPECLVRSIALRRMLVFHGMNDAIVRFGVRMRDGEFESHAWVEHDGRVVGDDVRHVRTFSIIDPLTISEPTGS